MRALLAIVLPGLALACAAPAATTRDVHGHPLPTTARLDADTTPAEIRCGGTRYFIVESPPPYTIGTRVGAAHVWIRDPVAMCARIRATELRAGRPW